MEEQSKKNFIINTIFYLIVGALIYVSGKFLLGYLFPFIIGGVVALTVQKPSSFLANKINAKKGICAAVLAVGIFIVIATAVFYLMYFLFNTFMSASHLFPNLISRLEVTMDKINEIISKSLNKISPSVSVQIEKTASELLDSLRKSLTSLISRLAASIASGLPSFLFSSVVTLVASCYIAKDFDRLIKFVGELMGDKLCIRLNKIKSVLTGSVFKLLKGYLLLMLITFTLLSFGLLILKTKRFWLIALLISLVDLLPVLGTGTVIIPWSIVEILSGDTTKGIGLIILYLIVAIMRNFLEPKVIGAQIGINPLFTLIAMFAGLRLFGIVGLFLFPIILITVIKYYKNEMANEGEKE